MIGNGVQELAEGFDSHYKVAHTNYFNSSVNRVCRHAEPLYLDSMCSACWEKEQQERRKDVEMFSMIVKF